MPPPAWQEMGGRLYIGGTPAITPAFPSPVRCFLLPHKVLDVCSPANPLFTKEGLPLLGPRTAESLVWHMLNSEVGSCCCSLGFEGAH